MLSLRSIFFAMVLTACASTRTVDTPWRIELTSSGGLAGRGAGSISVDSDGAVTVTRFDGRVCTATESPARFQTLLEQTRPASWRASYVPEQSCCDRIDWMLTVTEPHARHVTHWLDAPPESPRDLAALARALSERMRSEEACPP
ncbi:MAG TPA: hypothetical protein VF824_22170 [Thermoanaerobaculia bacterium]